MKRVKYNEYEHGIIKFTIKLTYLPHGGLHENPVVKINIMQFHDIPKTFFGRLFENSKYSLDSYIWDPLVTELPLKKYYTIRCDNFVYKNMKMNKTFREWSQI